MKNTVAIVGRPNVGKSTLFNRLVGGRYAIVDDQSGVTRDRIYGTTEWNGKTFNVVDTGGFVNQTNDVFEIAISEQVRIAIEEATVIVFVVDVTSGITSMDADVADMLRRSNKPVILAVNKVDNSKRHLDAAEFYGMGFDNVVYMASISGSGSGELLDEIAKYMAVESNELPDVPKIAIVGQPNAGKSTLVNALLGQPRNVVTEIAGTTRDSIHTRYTMYNNDFILIDTAGIRQKAKVHEDLEFYSVIRAVKAIDEADVCLLLIDGLKGLEQQDLKILSLIEEKKKGVVILVNKWDAVPKETNTAKIFEDNIRRKIAPFVDVPIIFISALEKLRILKGIVTGIEVFQNKKRKISTSKLNEVLEKAVAEVSPPAHRGNLISLKYMTQLPTQSPTFLIFCNYPEDVREPYRNYLEKRFREAFDFNGVPITIFFRKK